MSKLKYKPVAIQNECLGDNKNDPRIWVYVKLEAQGKSKKYYKTDVLEFPNRYYLQKFLDETELPVINESEFKADNVAQAIALSKASQH